MKPLTILAALILIVPAVIFALFRYAMRKLDQLIDEIIEKAEREKE